MTGSTEPQAGEQRRRAARERRSELRRVRVGDGEIVVARYSGYCYGVERALKIAEDAINGFEPPIYTLGPIIHNPGVVARLAQRGVTAIDDLSQVDKGTVVVRTHGVPPEVVEEARNRGLRVVDATCPFVTIAQSKASALHKADYLVLILGERDHPEVAGLKACAGSEAVVVEGVGDLEMATVADRRVGIVVQTPQPRDNLAALAGAVAPVARETLAYNTICDATEKRQSAAREVAREVDAVVVVGGRNSANTNRLVSLCGDIQPRTYHIEHAGELQAAWFADCRRIGVTAGASTPDDEIDAATQTIRTFLAARP